MLRINDLAILQKRGLFGHGDFLDSSWWFQPIWKICSSYWKISPVFGMKFPKNIWTHSFIHSFIQSCEARDRAIFELPPTSHLHDRKSPSKTYESISDDSVNPIFMPKILYDLVQGAAFCRAGGRRGGRKCGSAFFPWQPDGAIHLLGGSSQDEVSG